MRTPHAAPPSDMGSRPAPPGPDAARAPAGGGTEAGRSRQLLSGLRARLVAWFGLILLLALVASLLAAR